MDEIDGEVDPDQALGFLPNRVPKYKISGGLTDEFIVEIAI